MKRDFLKGLGIEDKDIIDKIMDENSSDIGKAKGELDNYKTQLENVTNELNTLKNSTKDYDSLKEQVTQLTADKTNLQAELTTKLEQLQKTHDTENKVRDAKAKNVKAVMALLDPTKDTDEQLEALKKGEDTSFLFGEAQPASPAGAKPNNPPSNGGQGGNPPTGKSFVEAIAAQLNSNK